jgi:hypothetical protein
LLHEISSLDLLEPQIKSDWLIPECRHHALKEHTDDFVEREGQQQVLRATFPGIRESVKDLVGKKMDARRNLG